MPAIPSLAFSNGAEPSDTRNLDSRQLHQVFRNLTTHLRSLLTPSPQSSPKQPQQPQSHTHLRRQDGIYLIEASYAGLDAGPSPGTIVGIVLGSVAGIIIVLWILWVLSSGSNPFLRTTTVITTTNDNDRGTTSSRRKRRHRSRSGASRRAQEMVSVVESRSGGSRSPVGRRGERIVRRETITREIRPERERDRSRYREQEAMLDDRIVEERVPGDDEIEVIDEGSYSDAPPRRGSSRRPSAYR